MAPANKYYDNSKASGTKKQPFTLYSQNLVQDDATLLHRREVEFMVKEHLNDLENRVQRRERVSYSMAQNIRTLQSDVECIKIDIGKLNTSTSFIKWVIGLGFTIVITILLAKL